MNILGPIDHLPVNHDKYMLLMVDNVSKYLICVTHSSLIINAQIK